MSKTKGNPTHLHVTMSDGSIWAVPIDVIALNRAKHYAEKNYGGDLARSLNEDTLPLFKSDDYSIEDWAANEMNWSDVKHVAQRVGGSNPVDFQEGWANGEKRVVREAT